MRLPKIPDLTFPTVKFNARQTPWDLSYALYQDAAGLSTLRFNQTDKRLLGPIVMERLPLIVKLHEILQGLLAAGKGQATVQDYLYCIRIFYRWANDTKRSPSLYSVRNDFLDWTEFLLQQRANGAIGHRAFYKYAATAGRVFDMFLDSSVPLLAQSRIRLRESSRKKRVLGKETDKQNLSEAFSFGHMLLDLTDSLTVETIRGNLPIRFHFRSGQVLEEWFGFVPQDCPRFLARPSWEKRRSLRRLHAWNSDPDGAVRGRHALTTLRIEAELLIFIACTGMNLTQARELKVGRFCYTSHHDGYQVRRVYKDRRRGEVEFEIYREYREHLDRYLVWRGIMFPNDVRLFPRWQAASDQEPANITFNAVKRKCKDLGIRYFGPQILRNTRSNWLLRRTRDPKVTAEMMQHAEQTLS